MKLLSVAVPCYNSEAYMRKSIESLLKGGEEMEILIVDDGSVKDNTAQIADEYAAKYPTIIKAIHQENKGHGGAVNTGLEHATGLYFKVVDSDDWVNEAALHKILTTLEKLVKSSKMVDVMFSNYVYEKEGAPKKMLMHYRKYFPQNQVFGWNSIRRLGPTTYVLMHSIIYRTSLLKDMDFKLPEHTFYVDNLYAFVPFSKVRTMYYLDVNFYRYYIGRADQSVNEEVMIKRIDQQIRVNNEMIDRMAGFRNISCGCREYMIHDLSILMTVTSVMLLRSGTAEHLRMKEMLWQRLRKKCPFVYRRIRSNIFGLGLNLPGKAGRQIVLAGYTLAQKLYGFN